MMAPVPLAWDVMVAGGAGVNEGEVAGEEGGEPAEG